MDCTHPKIWSDVEYVYRCLADEERTLAFRKAIKAVVRTGDVVLDLGTGSGIMALFAAEAGAAHVYAVEIGDYLFAAASKVFSLSRYADRIIPVHANAAELTLADVPKPRVVIAEMITTGLIGEPQAFVIGALWRAGLIDAKTIIVPEGLNTSVALISVDWNMYGHLIQFPIFADYFSRNINRPWQIVSETKTFSSVRFNGQLEDVIDLRTSIRAIASTTVRGIALTSETVFRQAQGVQDCISYCQPVLLPVDEITIHPGELLRLDLSYRLSGGFDSLRYSLLGNNRLSATIKA